MGRLEKSMRQRTSLPFGSSVNNWPLLWGQIPQIRGFFGRTRPHKCCAILSKPPKGTDVVGGIDRQNPSNRTSSSMKCTPLTGRLGQIGCRYNLQDSAKKYAPVLKCHELRGRTAPLTPQLCPLDPLGALPPGRRYRLASPPVWSANFKLLWCLSTNVVVSHMDLHV